MKARAVRTGSELLPVGLALAVSLAVLALALYNYRTVREWRRSSMAIVDRAAYESAQLLVTALTRDMRGAQMLVLANRDAGDFGASEADVGNQVATAFTRFPYPESFFVWQKRDGALLFFNRDNRRPAWAREIVDGPHYPVVVVRTAPFADALLERLETAAARRSDYTYVETSVGQDRYQIVARLEYADPFRDELVKVTGFTVNLSWVRAKYFSEIVDQVARIRQNDSTLDYFILDDAGAPVVGTVPREPATTFDLPLQFFDPWTVDHNVDAARPAIWKVSVSAANDPTVQWATRGADWTLVGVTVTAVGLALSFFLMARAVQARAALATMRGDFVAAVTHDLKTPLATMRAVANTMMRQTLDTTRIQKYAVMLVEENKRLSRLVDNMLAYARVTDVTEVYSFEAVCPAELVEESLGGFQQQLVAGGFEVAVDITPDLPMVRGDRTALRLALDNLIDNAIRYSADERWIGIRGNRENSMVVIEVRDRGVGIPPGEISTVQRKFVRGSRTRNSGTGLGLTIVQRVTTDHGGRLELHSELEKGTTVHLAFPIWRS